MHDLLSLSRTKSLTIHASPQLWNGSTASNTRAQNLFPLELLAPSLSEL